MEMTAFIHKLTIRNKINLLLGLFFIAGLTITTVNGVNRYHALQKDMHNGLKLHVENALSILRSHYELTNSGKLDENEAKQRALYNIAAMQHGSSGYFWVHDTNNNFLAHGLKPELVGQNFNTLDALTDEGVPVGRAIAALIQKSGAGFIRHKRAENDGINSGKSHKTSYVEGFEPWEMVVGTHAFSDKINAQFWSDMTVFLATLAAAYAGLALFGLWVSRSINMPLTTMHDYLHALSNNNLEEYKHGNWSRDIHSLFEAINTLRLSAVERQALENNQLNSKQQEKLRRRKVDTLIDSFKNQAGLLLDTVDSQTGQLDETSKTLSDIATDTSKEVLIAKDATKLTSDNVQAVATAAEELSTSIEEINRQVAMTTQVVERATNNANETNQTVGGLSDAAQKIGDVVNLIQDIAEQTNLLALNATIEAARAGEMGKGFAVVASEVKSLANQTAKATGEIASQVNAIQTSTSDAVTAIDQINRTMGEVNQLTSNIASAVYEQGAATVQISQSAMASATGTHNLTDNMAKVTDAVTQTNTTATNVREVSQNVAIKSSELRNAVNTFLDEVVEA